MQAWRSFGSAAEAYELGRPVWPLEAVEVAGVPRDATVLDLGAGTGKLTRVLVGRFAHVVAVEPLDGMRAILERAVPEAHALAGEAEAIPLRRKSVDAVFVAEAFHWFGGERAVAEIARVLRPSGTLVLMWTHPAGGAEPSLPDEFRVRVRELRDRRADWPYGGEKWRPAVETGPFGDIEQVTLPLEHVVDRERLLAYASSWSWIASLAERERQAELEALHALLPEGTWTLRLRVAVYWTRRR